MAQRGIDFQAEGLLDGLDGDQRGERLALLRQLESEGVPLREIRRARRRPGRSCSAPRTASWARARA